jgi:hypothetical protein
MEAIDLSGAPRSMKLGTIVSPWHYDGEASGAIQPANLRRRAISRYALRVDILPISKPGPAPAPMGQKRRDGQEHIVSSQQSFVRYLARVSLLHVREMPSLIGAAAKLWAI